MVYLVKRYSVFGFTVNLISSDFRILPDMTKSDLINIYLYIISSIKLEFLQIKNYE